MKTQNIYLNRLREQYIEVIRNHIPSENKYREVRYGGMRAFCIDTKLLSFDEIETMEEEVELKTIKLCRL